MELLKDFAGELVKKRYEEEPFLKEVFSKLESFSSRLKGVVNNYKNDLNAPYKTWIMDINSLESMIKEMPYVLTADAYLESLKSKAIENLKMFYFPSYVRHDNKDASIIYRIVSGCLSAFDDNYNVIFNCLSSVIDYEDAKENANNEIIKECYEFSYLISVERHNLCH